MTILRRGANRDGSAPGRECDGGAPFAMPEPIQPLGAVELMQRLEKMGYSHWDAMRLAMKIVTGRAGLAEPEDDIVWRAKDFNGLIANFTITVA